jgi:hypothetical protein
VLLAELTHTFARFALKTVCISDVNVEIAFAWKLFIADGTLAQKEARMNICEVTSNLYFCASNKRAIMTLEDLLKRKRQKEKKILK